MKERIGKMINCNDLYKIFRKNDLTFFTGVPDSTFKDWMKYLADNDGKELINRVAVIERDAIGLATGYHLATQKLGVVYMQNSGLGNTLNPITSLADPEVYKIPMILMIGWRGEPNKRDEPQHKKMGRITLPLLDTLEISYRVLPENIEEAERIIAEVKNLSEKESKPVALIIKKGILEEYNYPKKVKTNYEMGREDAIQIIIDNLNDSELIVSTTGKTSRELFEYREEKNFGHQNDFLMVGSMGEASVVGTEIALQKSNKKVIIFDGDGAAMMAMGAMATIGLYKPKNLYHIIFDNGSYDSTGGQPTFSENVNFEKVALACGYKGSKIVETKEDLINEIKERKFLEGPQMLVIKVNKGARKDLGRPTSTPIENKEIFMKQLNEVKRKILLNPGPATTTESVKYSQIVPDICPREKEFGNLMESISKDLIKISGGDEKNYACILFGGSGTASVDAVINSVISSNKKILIINNGAYGERMIKIARTYSIPYVELKFEEDSLPDLKRIEEELDKDKEIVYVSMVHHETTTGILNPIKKVGEIVKKYGGVFIVDAMSSFAGIPLDIKDCKIDFIISSSNKCIQGMAGCSFVICKKEELEKIKHNPKRSFYLDLYNQYNCFKEKYQMQFTPPVQVLYALKQAIKEFKEEGPENRYSRYLENWKTLVNGMEELGFKKLLKDQEESHILTTFLEPEDINYNFEKMHDSLYEKGFTIYPGKIGEQKTFRLANMGAINSKDIKDFLKSLKESMKEMNLTNLYSKENKSLAVILAAGMGVRLRPLTYNIPKGLIEIKGKTLLEHSLDRLAEVNIKKVILIIGYLGEMIKNKIGDKYKDMQIIYVENKEYEKTGSMYSLSQARGFINQDIILLDSDILYEKRALDVLKESKYSNSTLVAPCSNSNDEVFISTNENNRLTVLDKNIICRKESIGEFTGISKFSKKFVKKLFEKAEEDYLNNKKDYLCEEVVFAVNKENIDYPVYSVDIGYLKWAEIDNENDLRKAKEIIF